MRSRLGALPLAVVLALVASACHIPGHHAPKNPVGEPVIIVAGTFSPVAANDPLAARIAADGREAWVFELSGSVPGTANISASSRDLATFVADVRAKTGAAKVDLVGHSQGALVARHYIKSRGGAGLVDDYIGVAGPQHGAAAADIANVLTGCVGIVSCEQMTAGSSFLANLNSGDETPAGPDWHTLYTELDELVRPPSSARLDGATNTRLQDLCPLRVVGHLGLILDGAAYSIIDSILDGRTPRANCFAP